MGKTPIELDDQDIVNIICIAAKVADQLKKIKLNKQKPRDLALTLSKPIGYKKTIPAVSVIYSFNDPELDRPYSSGEFQKKIKRQVKTDVSNDTSDLLSDSYQQEYNGYKISSKDMNKAIEALEKEIGLIHITSKKGVKEIVRGKYTIQFGEGRPSYFMLPPDSVSLKKIMHRPKAFELIIKSLKTMGLLDNLEFLWETYLYLLSDLNDIHIQNLREITNMSRKLIIGDEDTTDPTFSEISKTEWESSRRDLQSVDENQIKLIARETNQLITQNWQFARAILLLLALKCN